MNDFATIEKSARQLRKECFVGDKEPIIDIVDLCVMNLGIAIKICSFHKDIDAKGYQSLDAVAYYDGQDNYQILVNTDNNVTLQKIRFTIAHVLGHLYLGHITDDKKTARSCRRIHLNTTDAQEQAANYFAAAFLVPNSVLKKYDAKTVASLYNVPLQVAKYRKIHFLK